MDCQSAIIVQHYRLEQGPERMHLDAVVRLYACANSIIYDGSGAGTE
jgi:hypothetical protein